MGGACAAEDDRGDHANQRPGQHRPWRKRPADERVAGAQQQAEQAARHKHAQRGAEHAAGGAQQGGLQGEQRLELAGAVAQGLPYGHLALPAAQQHLHGTGNADAAHQQAQDAGAFEQHVEQLGCIGVGLRPGGRG
jgi:hypothetical protein